MTPEQQQALALARARRRKEQEATPPVIATTQDGGKVYRMQDGTMSFSSPGMSTTNQETIAKIMEGATPAEGSVYGNVDQGGSFGAGVRSMLQGMTFGGGDEVVARGASLLPGGGSYDAELQRERARLEKGRDQNTGTSIMSEIAGALAVPLGAVNLTGNLPARMAQSAAATGGLSGVYGFLSGEGGAANRAQSAVDSAMLGAGVGAAIPVAGAAVQKGLESVMANRAISQAAKNAPTTEQLRAAGNAAYKAVDDAGVVIAPDAFQGAADDAISRMTGQGMDTGPMSLTPQSARVADIIGDTAASGNPVPFRDLDLMRRKAGIPASNMANRGESAVGSEAIAALDDFVNNITPAQVTQGNADNLPELIGTARDVWAKMRRSQMIDDAIENSQNYLSGEASGIRNQFARILKNDKLSRGFSDAEKALMRRVVNGSIPEQLLNLASGGIGQIATILGGAGLGSSAGAMGAMIGGGVGALGAGAARKGAEMLAGRNAEVVRAIIANGGLPQLPQLAPQTRSVIEALMQRGTAAAVQ